MFLCSGRKPVFTKTLNSTLHYTYTHSHTHTHTHTHTHLQNMSKNHPHTCCLVIAYLTIFRCRRRILVHRCHTLAAATPQTTPLNTRHRLVHPCPTWAAATPPTIQPPQSLSPLVTPPRLCPSRSATPLRPRLRFRSAAAVICRRQPRRRRATPTSCRWATWGTPRCRCRWATRRSCRRRCRCRRRGTPSPTSTRESPRPCRRRPGARSANSESGQGWGPAAPPTYRGAPRLVSYLGIRLFDFLGLKRLAITLSVRWSVSTFVRFVLKEKISAPIGV